MKKPLKKTKPECLSFTFYEEGNTIFFDEKPLIKGMPAKLLLYMLRTYQATGKTLFFLSELRADRDLGSIGNLEARLERLANRIKDRVVPLKLIRQKGCRILECACPISLDIR